MPTNVEDFAQVPGNRSNICPRRAVNSDIHVDELIVVVETGGGELADRDFPGGDGDGFAGAHPFVGAFAVEFDGADRGGSLHNASNKLGKCGGDIVVGEVGCVGTAYFGVVAMPSRMVAWYDFVAATRCVRNFVPRFMPTMSTPVASGSRVPACPTRRVWKMRRSRPMTSCEVIPAGLSTITRPEVANGSGEACVMTV